MNSFKKTERLTSRKLISSIFLQGNSIMSYPFRIVWIPIELQTKFPAQIVISVPKRRKKRAVDRNAIKRKIREVYRQNKHFLYDFLCENNMKIGIAIIFIGDNKKETVSYIEIEKIIIISLQKLIKDLQS